MMACEYCKDGNDLIIDAPNVEVSLDGNNLQADVLSDPFTYQWQSHIVKANYCLMCGERLGDDS